MKKTLIALAALAATSAFAQVTITGTFDPSVQATNKTYGNDSTVSQNLIGDNGQGTSQITFKGVEDLGGGLSAMFLMENDFYSQFQTGNTASGGVSGNNYLGAAGGEMYTGLSGSFGTVKLGAPNTPTLTVQGSRQPFGTKVGSGFGNVLGTGHVRENDSINYSSMPLFGGLTVGVNYTFAVNSDTGTVVNPQTGGVPGAIAANANSKTDIGLIYSAGPLFAGLSFYKQDGVNQQTNMALSYDFGAAKVTLGAHNETFTTAGVDTQASGTNLALVVPMGKISLLANIAQLDDKAATNNDRTITAIGARYDLSKRTSVYGRYVSEKTDNVSAVSTTVAKATTTTLVGIQHNF